MYRICIHCYWRDRNNYQCFDGHIQYKSRQNCTGFCAKNDTTAEDNFMFEQAKIEYEKFRRRKSEEMSEQERWKKGFCAKNDTTVEDMSEQERWKKGL